MDLNMYFTSYFEIFSTLEIFFGAQSTRQWYTKLQFFVMLHLDFYYENNFESIISKNHTVVTFSQLKTVWSIARHRRWLLRMPNDLNKCLTTYFDVLSALENFFELTNEEHCLQNLQFLSKFWQNWNFEMNALRSWALRKFSNALRTSK